MIFGSFENNFKLNKAASLIFEIQFNLKAKFPSIILNPLNLLMV
ncbi:hypothetical protein CHRY9390_01396 [Chryseobacterium aquaeductus]|uniref:Uncharacterized protein n=1 Tax=Chryseobacterium aquaeductus TaxID=2675056 RepID=A0A9N8MGH0_9FLAO|nr:hypothetical protein CHRY9390_01396 [Chryseobacterium potabilaquae]CAD7805629.1 hypothetical protein CHRY9390_01396 [Chryseobacterium aquaeductus]